MVSIHTLTRRVTQHSGKVNPIPYTVSIHTLTRRVTIVYIYLRFNQSVSIHTLTRRVTLNGLCRYDGLSGFNPHPHAEGDPAHHHPSTCARSFNPHPHAEGDCFFYLVGILGLVSIHTLTRRVTQPSRWHRQSCTVSIHTLTRRVT